MNKALTVIIPAYNVSRYIAQGMDSLLEEPSILPYLDIIVVNDGSTDDTLDKASKYANMFPESVSVINKENGGHGSGINVGIRAAKGKYFKVLDGDDWVRTDGLKELVNYIIEDKGKPDAIINPFEKVWEDGKREAIAFKRIKTYTLVEFQDIVQYNYTLPLHTITIRTSIFRDNYIPQIDEKISYDDMEYILFPIPYITSLVFLEEIVYEYRLGIAGQSMNPSQMAKKINMHTLVIDRLVDYYQSNQHLFNGAQEAYYLRELVDTIATNYMIKLHIGVTRRNLLEYRKKYNCLPMHLSRNKRFKFLFRHDSISLLVSRLYKLRHE